MLRRHGSALCVHDLVADHPWELTADWAYVRFHGPNALEHPYQGHYGEQGLFWMADRLTSWLAQGVDVYAYFNNDDWGSQSTTPAGLHNGSSRRLGLNELRAGSAL